MRVPIIVGIEARFHDAESLANSKRTVDKGTASCLPITSSMPSFGVCMADKPCTRIARGEDLNVGHQNIRSRVCRRIAHIHLGVSLEVPGHVHGREYDYRIC